MRTLVQAISYPAEVVVTEDGGLYHYTAAFEDIILSDTARTITEAVEESVRFIAFWAARKGYTVGVVRDITKPLAVAAALETRQQSTKVYRDLIRPIERSK